MKKLSEKIARFLTENLILPPALQQTKRKSLFPGGGPDQLNRVYLAADSSLLTRRHLRSHISW